jgi:hypothetical protein
MTGTRLAKNQPADKIGGPGGLAASLADQPRRTVRQETAVDNDHDDESL